MSILFVQSKNTLNSSNSTTLAATFTGNTITGNALILGAWIGSGAIINSIADSQSNTWTNAVSNFSGGADGEIWYALNITGGACTVTLTLNASVHSEVFATEFSGIASSSAIDQTTSTYSTTPSTTSTSGSITTTTANQLLFSFAVGWTTFSAGEVGWTATVPTLDGDAFEYKIVSSTGTYSATYTQSSGTYQALIASFKEATATTPSVAINPKMFP